MLLEMLLRQPLIDLTKHEDFSTKTKLLFSSEIKLINKLQILGNRLSTTRQVDHS